MAYLTRAMHRVSSSDGPRSWALRVSPAGGSQALPAGYLFRLLTLTNGDPDYV